MGALMLIAITYKVLQIFQQSHYQLRSFKKIIKYYYLKDRTNIWPPFVFFIFYLHLWYIQLIFGIYLGVLIFFKIKKKNIQNLKFTFRIRRLCTVIIIFKTLLVSILSWKLPLPHISSALAIVFLVSPFDILLAALFIQPLESLISGIYIRKAKRKLKAYKTTVIGITGSYGKTGTKNILFSFLQDKYMVLPTEGSYNTMNGVALSINRNLKSHCQIFIAEMGATGKRDIEKLVKFTAPKYGIITTIGPQHLETFKSMNNIISEKMKLVEGLPEDGIAVLNFDNEYIKNYPYKSKCRKISFGLCNEADYQAFDLKADLNGLNFKIRYKKKEVSLRTALLGTHNLYNILAAFALANELGVPLKELVYQTSVLEPVPNRLSLRTEANLIILDDGFNSNPEGFRNALDVLGYYSKRRILITPGIVEAGKNEEEINYSLARKISEICDLVILVETAASLAISRGLEELRFKNVKIVEDFREAMKYVRSKEKEAVVLIENDITDIYKL
jgi:UDP-N-acetylmuramoyl-tripeptide--D-alanyl-D-alanine ligase